MRKMLKASASLSLVGVTVVVTLACAGVVHDASANSTHDCSKGLPCRVPVQASRRHRRPLCVRYRCSTVAADAQAEILFVTEKHGMRYEDIVGTYARWRPTGRISRLAKDVYEYGPHGFGAVEVEPGIALAGRYVAFGMADCPEVHPCGSPGGGGPPFLTSVNVLNMETGQRMKTRETYPITDLALTPKGAVAWIERHEVRMAHTPSQFSNPPVLASSPAIEPHSLALSGSHLYWTEAGQPREAQIE